MNIFGYLTFLLLLSLTFVSCNQENSESLNSETTNTSSLGELEKVEASDIKEDLTTALEPTETQDTITEDTTAVKTEEAVVPLKEATKKEVIKAEVAKKSVAKKPVAKKKTAKKVTPKKNNESKEIIKEAIALTQASTQSDTIDTQAAAPKKTGSSSTLSTQLDPSLAASGKTGLRGQVSFDGYTDFKATDRNDKVYYAQSTLNLFYDLQGGDNIGLLIPMQKDLYGEYEEKFFLDARLSYAQNALVRNDNFIFNMRYGVLYPTTETSKVRDDMQMGIEINPTLIFPLTKLAQGLTFVYIPRFRKRFHKYETNRTGEYLVNDSLLQFFVLSYQMNPKWDISSTLLYVSSQRYDGARTDDSFLTVQELGYRVMPSVRARVGIMTGGNIINKQYGENETVEVFDSNSTEFYTGFAYQF